MVENNPIAAWLNENIIYDPNSYTHVGKAIKSTENEEVYIGASKWLYPNYCAFCEGIKVNPISLNRFSTLLLDLCNHQLNLSDVAKDRNRNGVFIQGLKIRDHLDDDAPFIEGLWVLSVTSRQSSVTNERQLTVTNDPSKVNNLGVTARGENERTTLVTGECTLVTENVMAVKPYVILETQSGEDCDGYVGTFKDFTKNDFSNGQSSTLEGESIKVVVSDNVVLENPPKRSSQPSQSTPVRISETPHCHDEPSQHKIIDRDELIKRIDYEMAQLGWTTAIGKEYLVSTYGVSSRKRLSDSQLLEFYKNLKAASSQPRQQPTPFSSPSQEGVRGWVGQLLQGLIPHPVSGTMKVKGRVVEENGDRCLEDKHGVTYPLAVMENILPLSWEGFNS